MSPAPSNSGQPSQEACASGLQVTAAGVDTASFGWRPDSSRVWAQIEAGLARGELAPLGSMGGVSSPTDAPAQLGMERLHERRMRGHGPTYMSVQPLRGVRWFVKPDRRLIYCEGRLAALLHDDATRTGLAPLGRVPNAAMLAALAFSQLGVPLMEMGEPWVRRLDATVDVAFEDPADGQRFLRAAVGMREGRRVRVDAGAAGLETVSWLAGGYRAGMRAARRNDVELRVYDLGLSRRSATAGSRVRVESQTRWRSDRAPSATRDPTEQVLSSRVLGELKSRAASAPPMGSLLDAAAVVNAARDAGSLKPQEAVTRLGYLVALETRGRAWWSDADERTRRRAIAALRELGIEPVAGVGPAAPASCRPTRTLTPADVVASVDDALRLGASG